MEVVIRFVNYLAWATAIISLGYSILTLLVSFTETPMDRLRNAAYGRIVTYPWVKRGIPGVVAVLWILANR